MTIIGFLLGMMLLALPVGAMHYMGLRIPVSRALVAVARMVAYAGVTAGALYVLDRYDSVALYVLFALLLVVLAAVSALVRSRLSVAGLFLPVVAALTVAVVVVAVWLVLATFGVDALVSPRYFIPVVGILSGTSVTVSAASLSAYYAGLHHHGQLYEYMLGNGATHAEALDHFTRRALERALTPGLSQMSTLMVGTSPVIMWTMMMCGADVLQAAALQLLFMAATLSVATGTVLLMTTLTRKYMFDDYGRLRELRGNRAEPANDNNEAAD